jgi:iron complex outermembrane receptor protein
MHFFKRIGYLWAVLTVLLLGSNVEELLNEYDHKNDLSQKTIDENKGHLFLFTRERLEKMHAKTLKDVFKATPVIYYHENRYALPDPLSAGTFEPYRSNFVRLYIDGVEITQGWFGSGLVLYGDVNIDFVDHIEFYYATPSYETSVEPAYLTIFLYSKDPKRDSGGKLGLIQGTQGYNSQNLSYADVTEKYSYMVNLSHTDAKRDKIPNGTANPLSRDFKRTQIFAHIKSENQFAHLQIMDKKTDALAGLSLDATPLVSKVDYLNVHLDYGVTWAENWKAQFAYEWLKSDIKQQDDLPFMIVNGVPVNRVFMTAKNSTYSGELTYKGVFGKHHLSAGIKGRIKKLDTLDLEGIGSITPKFNDETVLSAFAQDQYLVNDYALFSLGIEYNNILRNAVIDNEDLMQVRLGYIYHFKEWSYKAYLYRSMFALDPFSRYLDVSTSINVPAQVTLGLSQELSYSSQKMNAKLMVMMLKDQHGLVQNLGTGKTKYFFSILNYDYSFDIDNRFMMQLYYAHYKDIFFFDTLEDYSGYVSLFNSYKDFDFYNGVVWHQNSIDHKNYFDLTSTVSWNATENLTLTLKGDNLLDKAKRSDLYRIDPLSNAPLAPLSISPIDRRITLELEYTF